eukprot:g3467.t1
MQYIIANDKPITKPLKVWLFNTTEAILPPSSYRSAVVAAEHVSSAHISSSAGGKSLKQLFVHAEEIILVGSELYFFPGSDPQHQKGPFWPSHVSSALSSPTTVHASDNVHDATCTTTDGDVYVGEYKNGIRDGKGTYTYGSGSVYVGDFKDGKSHGKGTYTYDSGHVYVGEFKDDKRHGKGTCTHPDGTVYVGEYIGGKMHGKGTYTYASGNVYDGDFKDGMMHGKGTMTYADGGVYVGEYKDGKRVMVR